MPSALSSLLLCCAFCRAPTVDSSPGAGVAKSVEQCTSSALFIRNGIRETIARRVSAHAPDPVKNSPPRLGMRLYRCEHHIRRHPDLSAFGLDLRWHGDFCAETGPHRRRTLPPALSSQGAFAMCGVCHSGSDTTLIRRLYSIQHGALCQGAMQ